MSWIDSLIKIDTLNQSGFFFYLLLCTSITLAFFYLFRRQQKAWLIDRLPGPKTIPILGNALEVNVEPIELFKLLTGKMCDYDSISRLWIGLRPYCFISRCVPTELFANVFPKSVTIMSVVQWYGYGLHRTPTYLYLKHQLLRLEGYLQIWDCGYSFIKAWLLNRMYLLVYRANGVETILSSQKHIDKSQDYKFMHPWLGTGLLTSTGKKWQSRRKLLTPTFHFKILEDFMDVFNCQSSVFLTNLEAHCDGKPFDIFRPVTLCALDIILETAMGTSINAQGNAESDYVKAVYRAGALIQHRQVRPWLGPDFIFNLLGGGKEFNKCVETLHNFSNTTIAERRKEFNERKRLKEMTNKSDEEEEQMNLLGKRKRLAFLDLLLDASGSNSLSDQDIREEVDTFMFEGHDTTAAGINWSLYLLGSHPEIQAKVIEEMDAIFEGSDRPTTIADLRQMKYLEMCVKEALRIFPSVPLIARELREDVQIDGFTVPAGTTTMIVTYRLHRDPTQFPDPEVFKPERFLPENSINRHPYAYVPFSAGPRNCIGQKFAMLEEKVVLSSFFRKYRIESTVRREDLRILGELILRPEDGNVVKIFRR